MVRHVWQASFLIPAPLRRPCCRLSQACLRTPGAASAHQPLIIPRMRRGQHPPGQYSAMHCRPGVPPLGVSTALSATNAHY